MKYEYKKLDIPNYVNSLYLDSLKKSNLLSNEEVELKISNIGIFKFKGYVKAFRDRLSEFGIDDIFYLYDFDRGLSIKLLDFTSQIEIKLKTYLIETAYSITDNPFFYLVKENYKNDFKLSYDSLHTWEVKQSQTTTELYPHYRDYYLAKYDFKSNREAFLSDVQLIDLDERKNINYPPFHYFVESATLGTIINIVSKLQIGDNDIMKLVANKFGIYNPKVFISYLLRFKELRNRCAHSGRIFNRNYRSVKAIGKYRLIRKDIYDHRLLDVYFTLYFLLGEANQFDSSQDLENRFTEENFKEKDKKMEEFILNCMRKHKR
ncbi:MAG: Abi family protein [Sulfurovum sp.]|nr:Abi family protein [Sulfurovum sp.]